MKDLQLRAEIGRGGMGVVYEGWDPTLERVVAVKEALGAHSLAQLVREARVCGGLEHPNVVPVYELHAGPRIVMQRIDGTPWSSLIHDDLDEARGIAGDRTLLDLHLDILLKVGDAVALAHDRGVLHRDLKPENVMVGPDGEVYVLDWALAVSLGHGLGARLRLPLAARVQRVSGTPAYMPPEQALGEGLLYGPTVDVFALGACLAEIVTGRRAREGLPRDVLVEAAEGRPLHLGDDVSPELAALIRRATAPAPADRFPTVAALQAAIRTWRERRVARSLLDVADALQERLLHRASEQDSDGALAESLIAEARFAYHQVLEIWPDARAARDGLRVIQRLSVVVALERQDVEGARAGLDGLPDADDLRRAIGQLAERLARDRGRAEALRDLARRRDHRRGARMRNALAVVLAVVALLAAAGVVAWEALLGAPDPRAHALALGWCTLGVAVGAGLLALQTRHPVNRQVAGVALWVALLVDATWVWAWASGWQLSAIPAVLAVQLTGSLLVAGTSLEPRMLASALLFALTAVACGLLPQVAVALLGLGTTLALVSYALAPVQDPIRIVVRQRT